MKHTQGIPICCKVSDFNESFRCIKTYKLDRLEPVFCFIIEMRDGEVGVVFLVRETAKSVCDPTT